MVTAAHALVTAQLCETRNGLDSRIRTKAKKRIPEDLMDKYIKRPIAIEATQLTEEMTIHTLEGDMKGGIGDWLIKGVNGELYPCKDDIFQKTYREQSETESSVSGDTSDGYHTFDELYHHRAVLFAALQMAYPKLSWKSKQHSDGTMFDNMFIAGIDTPEGTYAYHLEMNEWDIFACKEIETAPEWDGHLPKDVDRLLSLRVADWEGLTSELLTPHNDLWEQLASA